ncbi:MAG: hypothetical protein PHI35_06315 [Victivallaceae bacterium]|nr:hypothetical protein [Victivallaceae bacterium]
MDKIEFANLTRGITSARVAELTNRSLSQIQTYLAGKAKIPYEVARFAIELGDMLERLKITDHPAGRRMRRVIGGRLYDTASASLIAERESGYPSDNNYVDEGLYRTKNGVYFLAGDKIEILGESEARQWVENYAAAETYIAAFCKPPEA